MGVGVGGSKRKRPDDIVGEKIDMFVAPKEQESKWGSSFLLAQWLRKRFQFNS